MAANEQLPCRTVESIGESVKSVPGTTLNDTFPVGCEPAALLTVTVSAALLLPAGVVANTPLLAMVAVMAGPVAPLPIRFTVWVSMDELP